MRLIDADKLYRVGYRDSYLHCDSVTLDDIAKMSTAYDVNAVVERLEELKKIEQNKKDECDKNGFGDGEQIYTDGVTQGRYEAFMEAITIVKNGGRK